MKIVYIIENAKIIITVEILKGLTFPWERPELRNKEEKKECSLFRVVLLSIMKERINGIILVSRTRVWITLVMEATGTLTDNVPPPRHLSHYASVRRLQKQHRLLLTWLFVQSTPFTLQLTVLESAVQTVSSFNAGKEPLGKWECWGGEAVGWLWHCIRNIREVNPCHEKLFGREWSFCSRRLVCFLSPRQPYQY